MKTIEITVCRRTYTTYEVDVADHFDVDAPGVYARLEASYFDGEWGQGAYTYEEVANWDIDDVQEL